MSDEQSGAPLIIAVRAPFLDDPAQPMLFPAWSKKKSVECIGLG